MLHIYNITKRLHGLAGGKVGVAFADDTAYKRPTLGGDRCTLSIGKKVSRWQ